MEQHSAPGGNHAHQVVTSRDSLAVIDKQDQSSDSESTKVTKVTHTLYIEKHIGYNE